MKSGRMLLAALILIGLIGIIFNGSAIYSRFFYLGLFLVIGSSLWTYWIGRSFQLNRSSRVQRANVGDIFEENYDLVNHSRLMAPWVEVINATNLPFASGSRILTAFVGKQKRQYNARTWLTKRGAFTLGPTRVSVGDPFGFFRYEKEFPARQTLVVLPMLFEVSSFVFPPGLLPGGQVIRRKSADITPHAAGVREYVHGDAIKRIHWPSSLRRNRLIVKEFEQDPQAEVWLFLDAQKGVYPTQPHEQTSIPVEAMLFGRKPKFTLPPAAFEYAISIAASLTHYFLSQRRAVGFVSAAQGAGENYIVHPAERSERQEVKILETLAFMEANSALSLLALTSAQASQIPQGSSIVLITSNIKPELLFAVEELRKRYLRPIVVLLEPASFGGAQTADQTLIALRERRAPVCLVNCNAELSQVLSHFVSDLAPRDLKKWQTPTSSQLI
ncbi:MAG: DUF58 domain-containing protein [Anaerolineales bacterium]|nr:DUF58 domain-containing protein [Anaerolineales bacterium]MCZ2121659.1 DUF58 domain-containing protein [Anaerolineales bacterium]